MSEDRNERPQEQIIEETKSELDRLATDHIRSFDLTSYVGYAKNFFDGNTHEYELPPITNIELNAFAGAIESLADRTKTPVLHYNMEGWGARDGQRLVGITQETMLKGVTIDHSFDTQDGHVSIVLRREKAP